MPKPTFGPRIQYVLTLMLLFFTLSSLNSVKDYDDITVSLESKILPTCSGSLDGTLKINVSGGTPPYQYTWTSTNYTGSSSQDITGIGPGTYKVTITDSSTPIKSTTFTEVVNYEDNQLPVVVVKDITVQLDSNGQASITPEEINDGSTDNCSIDTLSLNESDFDCSNLGSNSVTLTVTDVNGNNSTGTASVNVVDSVDPTAIAQDITVQLDSNGQASITPEEMNDGSTDNCSISTLSLSKTDFDCNDVGSNSVTLTVTDAKGNSSIATASVIIEDSVDPTAIAQDITVQLDSNGQASITPEEINDGSTDNCSISTLSLSKTDFDCNDVGSISVTLTVTDAKGNSSIATASVIIEDSVDPTAIAQDITVQLDSNGQASITPEEINDGSTDNCSISTLSLSKTDFDCNDVGSNSVTLTVTDAKGNSSTATASVIVVDSVDPTAIAQDITVQLDSNGQASITPEEINDGSTDNCSISTLSLSKTDFDCNDVGSNSVTLTVTDANGNSSTAAASVIVVDSVDPTAIAQDITIQLDSNGQASITPEEINDGSTDNCSISTLSLSKTDFDCNDVGSNSVILTVKDEMVTVVHQMPQLSFKIMKIR